MLSNSRGKCKLGYSISYVYSDMDIEYETMRIMYDV